jgi:hypothetical protein
MWRAALRRLAVIGGIVIGATALISAAIGALAHKNVAHAVAVGYYVVGSIALLGTLGFGLRGPRRREWGETDRPVGGLFSFVRPAGNVRRATSDERFEARRNSLVFFGFALFLLVLGAVVDPAQALF